ncbi:hypothetical protein [Clostridium sp. MD294]|uniref:hypothetical protein n=1 Tax=Clostridium sp. MD294 TaxID=97138 RepID=UPI0002CB8EC5|nr:hypothetical protein [Clostridium sp. MD294]NDO47430.1 hypothetical protein [Clostridium sp. MD294]USF29499.1 hypothetical protein C820_000890 [Clostridium sp. MD294]
MKRKLFLLLTASILSMSCIGSAFASSNEFEPYYDEEGTLITPAGGYNGVLLEDKEETSPRMTSNLLFEMSYSLSPKGWIDTSQSSKPKYLMSNDISNGVLEIYSSPDSSNKKGNLTIGLCYVDANGLMSMPYNLRGTFSATQDETQHIYNPKLKVKTKYYGEVVNDSGSNRASGTVEFIDLD